jgi:hypothetical protein
MKKILYIGGGIVLVGVLAFAYYALSPLFINIELDEALPPGAENTQEETEESSATQTPAQPQTQAESQESAGAPVVGTTGHPASGTARIVETGGTTYVRYEDFKTINGPDLYVYLATDLEATEFVDLGRLRATEGNVNYEVPAGVDISEYRYVLVWCKAFSVLFNSADLAQAR